MQWPGPRARGEADLDGAEPAAVRALRLGKEDLFVCRDAPVTDEQAADLALTRKLKTV